MNWISSFTQFIFLNIISQISIIIIYKIMHRIFEKYTNVESYIKFLRVGIVYISIPFSVYFWIINYLVYSDTVLFWFPPLIGFVYTLLGILYIIFLYPKLKDLIIEVFQLKQICSCAYMPEQEIQDLAKDVYWDLLDELYSDDLHGRIKKSISLWLCKYIPVVKISCLINQPLICGIFRPIIIIPEPIYSNYEKLIHLESRHNKVLEVQDINLIIRHELIHYFKHDNFYIIAIQFMRRLFYINPFLGDIADDYLSLCEYNCDIECSKLVGAKNYYNFLLLVNDYVGKRRISIVSNLSSNDIKERIIVFNNFEKMKGSNKNMRKFWNVSMFVLLLVLSVFLNTTTDYAYNRVTCIDNSFYLEEPYEEPYVSDEYIIDLSEDDTYIETDSEDAYKSARSTSVTWNIGSNSGHQSAGISLVSGNTINIMVMSNSNNSTRIGIVQPDNTYRYRYVNGNGYASFNITQSGTYRVRVENRGAGVITYDVAWAIY